MAFLPERQECGNGPLVPLWSGGSRCVIKGTGSTDQLRDYDGYDLIPNDANDETCCIDKGDVNVVVDHDYLGNPRPLGKGYDIGAYEVQ